ncbi:glutaminyl-peptide cyclotransferase [Nocardia sp. KC 131]|uniref:glutaminyl-peptide cyclotransferase n=1 Tax=Nocardia arseniciresistens TaxID=3392119 RepID=UPI00398F746B
MERNQRSLAAIVLVSVLTMTGCGGADDQPQRRKIEVIGTGPHDSAAFTQGLEIDGTVRYEGTGKPGASSIRATDLNTGAELARVDLPAPYFGEGVTLAGDTLWQITWRNHVAFARDPVTLVERGRVPYEGEGWGICTRAGRLVMSDGTGKLTFRDPVTFAPTGTVTLRNRRTAHLNELDCAADGSVYANDYPTDTILRIDPDTGRVLDEIAAGGLLAPTTRAHTDVLNGIAQIPGTDRFLLTGKYWPTMFEVRFVPA